MLISTFFVYGMVIGENYRGFLSNANIRILKSKDLDQSYKFKKIEEQYQRMQMCIPEETTMLTRLTHPFLLDFKRNEILIIDYPGG